MNALSVRLNISSLSKIAASLLLTGAAATTCAQQAGAPLTVDHADPGRTLLQLNDEEPTTPTPTSEGREGLIHLDVAARDQQGVALGDSEGHRPDLDAGRNRKEDFVSSTIEPGG